VNIPLLISLLLPRVKTIGYGRLVFRAANKILRQKGEDLIKDKKTAGKTISAVETSLVDLTFGVYIESRSFTEEEKQKRIESYLKETLI